MKVTLNFPISKLNGSTKSDINNCYQPWKDICVLRKKSRPKTIPLRGFTQASLFSGHCAEQWSLCSAAQKKAWSDYADWLNNQFPKNSRYFSPYGAFFRSNLFICIYRDADYMLDPPRQRQIIIPTIEQVCAQTELSSFLQVNITNLHLNYDFYVLVKTTLPKFGYLPAFRSSELCCIKNMPVDSSLVCYANSSFYDSDFNNTFRLFQANQYIYLETTYFDEFGNVALPRIKPFQISQY